MNWLVRLWRRLCDNCPDCGNWLYHVEPGRAVCIDCLNRRIAQ